MYDEDFKGSVSRVRDTLARIKSGEKSMINESTENVITEEAKDFEPGTQVRSRVSGRVGTIKAVLNEDTVQVKFRDEAFVRTTHRSNVVAI
jgi:hypothetical protein